MDILKKDSKVFLSIDLDINSFSLFYFFIIKIHFNFILVYKKNINTKTKYIINQNANSLQNKGKKCSKSSGLLIKFFSFYT